MKAKLILITGVVSLSASGIAHAAPALLGPQITAGVVGDANGDGIANDLDLAIVQANQNKAGDRTKGDFDGNGLVDANDLTLINRNLLRRQPDAFFGKIADLSTVNPSGGGNFVGFDTPPAIDHLGNITFSASGSTTSGVYKWSANVLSKIADTNTTIPSTTVAGEKFTNSFTQPTISANKVIFQAQGTVTQGLYTHNGTTLSRVADNFQVRTEGTISNFSDPAYADPYAAFVGTRATATSVYTAQGTTLTIAASTGDAIPGGIAGTKFTAFNDAVSNGTSTWFIGRGSSSQIGIYKKTGATTVNLVDRNTAIPGTSLKFGAINGTGGIARLSQDADNVSFNGIFGGNLGVFAIFGSTLNRVADLTTYIPEGRGKFTNFGVTSSIGGSAVAFVGLDGNSNPGIYAWINGEIERVIDTSTTLGGKAIANLEISRQAVIGNKVVFNADFVDGTTGIYSASLLRTRVPGDVNGDASVDMADLAIVMANQGQTGGRSRGDLNWDGVIDIRDYQILERNLGTTSVAPLMGDTDGDGKVDFNDFKTLMSNNGKYGGFGQGDFNGDGFIDIRDYQLLTENLGKTRTAFQPFGATAIPSDTPDQYGAVTNAVTPEPTGALAALVGLALAGARRRRRDR